MGVDKLGVDKMGVDEMGSRRSGNKPRLHGLVSMNDCEESLIFEKNDMSLVVRKWSSGRPGPTQTGLYSHRRLLDA